MQIVVNLAGAQLYHDSQNLSDMCKFFKMSLIRIQCSIILVLRFAKRWYMKSSELSHLSKSSLKQKCTSKCSCLEPKLDIIQISMPNR